MEFCGSSGQSVNGNHTNSSTSSSTILGWDVWEPNNSNHHNTTNISTNNSSRSMGWPTATTNSIGTAATFYVSDTAGGEGLLPPGYAGNQQPELYGSACGAHRMHPDPHLVCLNLGKRHYFEGHVAAAMVAEEAASVSAAGERRSAESFPMAVQKRGKGYCGGGGGGGPAAAVPRCQVEGCHVALVNVKDYHRRHKVCETHSKAPKVVVLGMEQRFCQQCSRFHVVSEFEETKRSCKRRLAGHNERRRKSSHDSIARNSSLNGRALSLLSSKTDEFNNWVPPNSDLSSRSSAALRELIAENRAAIFSRQLVLERKDSWHLSHQPEHQHHLEMEDFGASSSSMQSNQHQFFSEPSPPHYGWERLNEGGCSSGAGAHVTLDLMQAPRPAPFQFLPGARDKIKGGEEDCSDLWNSF